MFLGTKASELRDVDGFSLVERNQAFLLVFFLGVLK
jgi:hypothetical protein